jgi:hypothetical protein
VIVDDFPDWKVFSEGESVFCNVRHELSRIDENIAFGAIGDSEIVDLGSMLWL